MIEGERISLYDEGGERRIRYGEWRRDPNGEWVIPELVGYSDYSGGTVERSNLLVFVDEFADHEDIEWMRVHGGHGTDQLIVRVDADERVPAIGEFFDYPLADEYHHSQLEHELEVEEWERNGRHDFRRWLKKYKDVPDDLDEDEWDDMVDALTDEQLGTLWFDTVREGHGDEVRHETGLNVYFDFDRAFIHRDVYGDVAELVPDWTRFLRLRLSQVLPRDAVLRVDEWGRKTLQALFDYLEEKAKGLTVPEKPTLGDDAELLLRDYGLSTRLLIDGTLKDDQTHENSFSVYDSAGARLFQGPVHEAVAFVVVLKLLELTDKWTQHQWEVLLDTLEEDGPDALKPGGRGRALGRR